MESELASRKFKQYICENSVELKEFERALQNAYNQHVLEAKIAMDRTERIKENIVEQQIAQLEREQYQLEEDRLRAEEEARRKHEKEFATVLRAQMHEKNKRLDEEMANSIRERFTLNEELEKEKNEEERAIERKEIAKKNLRKEQMEFQQLRQKLQEEERRRSAAEEMKFKNEATILAINDAAIIEERQKRIKAFEVIQRRIADQLSEMETLRKSREEIRQKLLCIEREELENRKYEEEQKVIRLRRERSKQTFSDIIRGKQIEKQAMKEDDKFYAERVRQELELATEREKLVEEDRKREKNTVREENRKLIYYRRQLRGAELMAEKAEAMAEEQIRANRERVIAEERLRLLRSLDPEMLRHLPRGSLTEEDLLCLNNQMK